MGIGLEAPRVGGEGVSIVRSRRSSKDTLINIAFGLAFLPCLKGTRRIGYDPNSYGPGWEFTKLLTKICKIFPNF